MESAWHVHPMYIQSQLRVHEVPFTHQPPLTHQYARCTVGYVTGIRHRICIEKAFHVHETTLLCTLSCHGMYMLCTCQCMLMYVESS